MTGANWIMFSGNAINKFHICTVNVKKSDDASEKHIIRITLSNGLVLDEFYESMESATSVFKQLTGVTE